jgi:hypothetical protein
MIRALGKGGVFSVETWAVNFISFVGIFMGTGLI